jgi:hypothetical protein
MEYWNDVSTCPQCFATRGRWGGRKSINMIFSAFAAHYFIPDGRDLQHSNIPLFHGADEELNPQKIL